MKKYITLLLVILSLSCNKETEITITKVSGSPEYVNAKLSLDDPIISEDGYEFSFNVDQYELGLQTLKDFEYNLANSAKGQHIHFIVNNDPYSAHYNEKFSKKLEGDSNVILAFLSRSYHESVKNKNAYVLMQTGEKYNLNNEYIFYSRPKGKYSGNAAEKILLDFYLVNTEISKEGNSLPGDGMVYLEDRTFFITYFDVNSSKIIEKYLKIDCNCELIYFNEKNPIIKNSIN